jgi:hypothetical protein
VGFHAEICEYNSKGLHVYVSADYQDGCLRFSGQDLGSKVEEAWGDSDYEYWYSFDHENTKKLMNVLQVQETGFEQSIRARFSGIDGMRNLREFCMAHDISWGFNSYA